MYLASQHIFIVFNNKNHLWSLWGIFRSMKCSYMFVYEKKGKNIQVFNFTFIMLQFLWVLYSWMLIIQISQFHTRFCNSFFFLPYIYISHYSYINKQKQTFLLFLLKATLEILPLVQLLMLMLHYQLILHCCGFSSVP